MKNCLKWIFIGTAFVTLSANTLADELIIKYKVTPQEQQQLKAKTLSINALRSQQMQPLSVSQLNKLSAVAGEHLIQKGAIGTGAHVFTIEGNKPIDQVIKNIANDPDIEYVVPNIRLYAMSVPTPNPLQWDMQNTSAAPGGGTWYGDNFVNAWTSLENKGVVSGSNITVAVIDTGYTPNPNILSNLIEFNGSPGVYGFQFISDCRNAGSCPASTPSESAQISYQANGLDIGDYITQAQINQSNGYFNNIDCELNPSNSSRDSSWHGSHVTGIIAANGYNGSNYITGSAYGAKIVPIRALGKCGTNSIDFANAIVWASGGSGGTGVAANPNPAQVINLSLGAVGSCSADIQDAINTAVNNGSVVVVAAGNSAINVANAVPANCKNVISVSATGPTRNLTYYSNWGNTSISASGGDNYFSGGMIYSTLWNSPESFVLSDGPKWGYLQGTSQAAPHVAAAVADIISYLKSVNKPYTLPGIIKVLQETSTPFSQGQNCSQYGCVTSGALNVQAAINKVIAEPDSANSGSNPPGLNNLAGGGCTMVKNGDDYGLILVLLLIAGLYIYRRRSKKNT